MLDLAPYRAIVVIFGQEGCPACEAYVPQVIARVEAFAAQGHPIWVHDPVKPPMPSGVPVLIYDVAPKEGGTPAELEESRRVQEFADRFNVSGLPTTVVLRKGAGTFKLEGVQATGHIDQTLQLALAQS